MRYRGAWRCHCPVSRGEWRTDSQLESLRKPYLDVPVLIQVIDAGDAAPVAVGIVNVPHVPKPIAWVTRHHGLVDMEGGGLLSPEGPREEAGSPFLPLVWPGPP